MQQSPRTGGFEPARPGPLGRLMQERQRRIGALTLRATSTTADITSDRTGTRLSQATDLRSALRRYQAGEDIFGDERGSKLESSASRWRSSLKLGVSSFGVAARNRDNAAKSVTARAMDKRGSANFLLDALNLSDHIQLLAANEVRLMRRLNYMHPTRLDTRNGSWPPRDSPSARRSAHDSPGGGTDAASFGRRIGTRIDEMPKWRPRNSVATTIISSHQGSPAASSAATSGRGAPGPARSLSDGPANGGWQLGEPASYGPASTRRAASLRPARKPPETSRTDADRPGVRSGRLTGNDAPLFRRLPKDERLPLTINFTPSVVLKGLPDQASKQSILEALAQHSHELILLVEREVAKYKRVEFLGQGSDYRWQG
jgi:hypothetical protein